MNNYDVIIIGAGPGGIFSAYELMKLSTMSANCWLTLRLLLIFSSMMEPYPNPRPMAKMMARMGTVASMVE